MEETGTKPTKVYIVTGNCFPEYEDDNNMLILFVHTNKEKAENFSTLSKRSMYNVNITEYIIYNE